MRLLTVTSVAAAIAALSLPSAAEAKPRHHGRGYSSVYVGVSPSYGYNNYGYRAPYGGYGATPGYYGNAVPYGYGAPYYGNVGGYGYGSPYYGNVGAYGYGSRYYGMSRDQRRHARQQARHQRRDYRRGW